LSHVQNPQHNRYSHLFLAAPFPILYMGLGGGVVVIGDRNT